MRVVLIIVLLQQLNSNLCIVLGRDNMQNRSVIKLEIASGN